MDIEDQSSTSDADAAAVFDAAANLAATAFFAHVTLYLATFFTVGLAESTAFLPVFVATSLAVGLLASV